MTQKEIELILSSPYACVTCHVVSRSMMSPGEGLTSAD